MDTLSERALASLPVDLLPVLLDRLPEVFFRTDQSGRLVWVSSNASRQLGYSVDEMIGMAAGGLYVRPEERSRIVKDVRAGQGSAVAVEVELLRKDGGTIWAVVNACSLIGPSDEFLGIQGDYRVLEDPQDPGGQRGPLPPPVGCGHRGHLHPLPGQDHRLQSCLRGHVPLFAGRVSPDVGLGRHRSARYSPRQGDGPSAIRGPL